MLVRFDTGLTLAKADAQRLFADLVEWSAARRWWCGAPNVLVEHADQSRLHGTLEATFDDEPIDLAMGHRDALAFLGFLSTTGVEWQIAVEGSRSSATVPDPDAVFAANPTRYGGQVDGHTSRGLGAAAHRARWLGETIALVDAPALELPERDDGEVRAGRWRWAAAVAVTPTDLADRACLALGLRPIGVRWRARDRAMFTDQLRAVLAANQAYRSSATMPLELAASFAAAWTGEDAAWLVNGDTTHSWQPLGEATFETGFVVVSADRVAMIYIADED